MGLDYRKGKSQSGCHPVAVITLELGVYVLVLLFASTEGWVQQNSSDLQLVLHDLVQLLEGSFQGYWHCFVFDEVDFTTSCPWCELRLGLGTEL